MESWLGEYGLAAVPVLLLLSGTGIPGISEDVVLLTAGWMSAAGRAPTWVVIAMTWPAVLASDQILFSLARAGRRSTRVREGRLARAAESLARWGAPAVFVARFLAPVRMLVFVAMGLGGLSRAKFLGADAAAATLSVPLMVWLGRRYGPAMQKVLAPFAPWVGGAVVAVFLGYVLVRRLRRRA